MKTSRAHTATYHMDVFASDLAAGERLTALAVWSVCTEAGVAPDLTMADLASLTGLTIRSVQRHIHSLEAAGYLRIEPTSGRPNSYRLCVPTPSNNVIPLR